MGCANRNGLEARLQFRLDSQLIAATGSLTSGGLAAIHGARIKAAALADKEKKSNAGRK